MVLLQKHGALIISAIALIVAIRSCVISEMNSIIAHRPDPKVYIQSTNIPIGKVSNYENTFINIPIIVDNRGYGIAKNVKVAMLEDPGTGLHKPFTKEIPHLLGGSTSEIKWFNHAVPNGIRDKYIQKELVYKMKIFLEYDDVRDKRYYSVEWFKLEPKYIGKDVGYILYFVPLGYWHSDVNLEEYQRHAKMEIDF